jgi:hypothetical protein
LVQVPAIADVCWAEHTAKLSYSTSKTNAKKIRKNCKFDEKEEIYLKKNRLIPLKYKNQGDEVRIWGLLDIPTGQQTYKRNIKAHRHCSNFNA